MDPFRRETTLNISPAYAKPGLSFGGSCLLNTCDALDDAVFRLDLKMPLLESVLHLRPY